MRKYFAKLASWQPFESQPIADDEVGDVPGWVLITLMTAAIVIVLWGVAGPALENLFHQAVDRFGGM